jgi:transposase
MPMKYDENTKARAVRLVVDHRWLRQAEVDAGNVDGVTTMAAGELRELKRKNAGLERTIEILKAATSFFVRERCPQHR